MPNKTNTHIRKLLVGDIWRQYKEIVLECNKTLPSFITDEAGQRKTTGTDIHTHRVGGMRECARERRKYTLRL